MSKYAEALTVLNKEQLEAVEHLDGPALVIAGPGTGKTQLLAVRIAYLLQNTDTQPHNVLCLTFTDVATTTLRKRVEQLTQSQEVAAGVRIQTYHAFAQSLADQSNSFTLADQLKQFEIMEALSQKLPYSNPLHIRHDDTTKIIGNLLSRVGHCKNAGLSPKQLKLQITSNKLWLSQYYTALLNYPELYNKVSNKTRNFYVSLLTTLESINTCPLGLACSKQLADALDADHNKDISTWKKDWLDTLGKNAEDRKLTVKIERLASFAQLYEHYQQQLQKNNLYDYNDLILQAIEKLRNDDNFRLSLQEKYLYIMADEYQDTNPAQAEILTQLGTNPVSESKPNIMVVGDDDQAIYGFQGAQSTVMQDFLDRWIAVKVITLIENYRSTQEIIDYARSGIVMAQNRLEDTAQITKLLHAQTNNAASVESLVAKSGLSDQAVVLEFLKDAKNTAIISPKHKRLKGVAKQLSKLGIEYSYTYQDNLLSQSSLLWFMDCLELACKPDLSSHLWPIVMAQDKWEIKPEILWEIARKRPESWWDEVARKPECHELIQFLNILQKLLPLKVEVNAINNCTNDEKLTSSALDLCLHATKYYDKTDITWLELLHYWHLSTRANLHLPTQIQEGKPSAPIQLWSTHGSKGNEFDQVVLWPHTDFVWYKERGNHNSIGLTADLRYIEPRKDSESDKVRLWYVAATRARKKLTLLRSQDQPRPHWTPQIPDQLINRSIDETAPLLDSQDWQAKHRNAFNRIPKDWLTNYRLTPSDLVQFLDPQYGGPTKMMLERLLKLPQKTNIESQFGVIMHSYMHTVLKDRSRRADKVAYKAINSLLTTNDIKDKLLQRARDCIARIQPATEDFPFSSESLYEHRLFSKELGLHGTLDFLDVDGTRARVIDFKTGTSYKSWSTTGNSALKFHKFALQLLCYKLLVMDNYPHVENISLELCFIEGEHPLKSIIYSHAEEDTNRTRLLVTAVLRSIRSLTFPNENNTKPNLSYMLEVEDKLLAS